MLKLDETLLIVSLHASGDYRRAHGDRRGRRHDYYIRKPNLEGKSVVRSNIDDCVACRVQDSALARNSPHGASKLVTLGTAMMTSRSEV